MNHALGKHLIADLWVKDPHLLDQPDSIQKALTAACAAGGFTVLNLSTHAFAPHGVTAVALLSESHISIHTWPEHAYAAVDIFTCAGSARKAMEELRRRLDVENMEIRELDRGIVGQAGARPPHSLGNRGVDIPRAV